MRLKAIPQACLWLPGFEPPGEPTINVVQPAASIVVSPPPVVETAAEKHHEPARAIWPQLDASIFEGLSGAVTKFDANIAAIQLLRDLERDARAPSDDERKILNRYTGWGGLPQAFNLNQSDQVWVKRAEQLKALLSESEHAAAEASTPNAHYTSHEVIGAMWAMISRLGFKGGRIIEPAAGVGYFLGGMPADMARQSRVTAIELDELSASVNPTTWSE